MMKPCSFSVLHPANYWNEHTRVLAWRPVSCMCSFRSKHKDPSRQHMPGNMEIYVGQLSVCCSHGQNIFCLLAPALVWFSCLLPPAVCFLFAFISPSWLVCLFPPVPPHLCLSLESGTKSNQITRSNSMLTYNDNNNYPRTYITSRWLFITCATVQPPQPDMSATPRTWGEDIKGCPGWRKRSG